MLKERRAPRLSFCFDACTQAAGDRGNCGLLPGANLLQAWLLCPRILHYAKDLARNLCCHSGSACVAAIALINCSGSWVAAALLIPAAAEKHLFLPAHLLPVQYTHTRAYTHTATAPAAPRIGGQRGWAACAMAEAGLNESLSVDKEEAATWN